MDRRVLLGGIAGVLLGGMFGTAPRAEAQGMPRSGSPNIIANFKQRAKMRDRRAGMGPGGPRRGGGFGRGPGGRGGMRGMMLRRRRMMRMRRQRMMRRWRGVFN